MKTEILTILRESEGYVSGQQLCEQMHVSRTAVWKVIEQLKKEGIYPAYHMNKANWLSIILDDSISDYDIILMINESYDLVMGNNDKKRYFKRKEQK